MAAQDLGNLADYLVNGDNYERVQPDGSTLVIPGRPNPSPSPLLSPTSDCNAPDCYYPIIGDCTPDPGFTGACALYVHDRVTGWYYMARAADFQADQISCACALAGVSAGTPAEQCQAAIQAAVDNLAGRAIWSTTAPWMLAEMGLPRSTPFFPDFYFIACLPQAIIIPNLITPPPSASCTAGEVQRDAAGACPKGFFVDPNISPCCKPLDPPIPVNMHNLAGMTRHAFGVPPDLEAIRSRLGSTRFELGAVKVAQPPPLPALAVMPLPAGKCGCESSEEIDEL